MNPQSKSWGAGLLVTGLVLLLPVAAGAQTFTPGRNPIDSLAASQAAARIEWARRCALQVNVVSPSNGYGAGWITANSELAIEYLESDPNTNLNGMNAYLGSSQGYQVNLRYLNLLYSSGPTSQSVDAYGFKKWTRSSSVMLARPWYPSYGSAPDDSSGIVLYPHPMLSDCRLYTNTSGTMPFTGPFYVTGFWGGI